MKGQTIIELNNIKTGQKERYVDNNMVTNALAEYFANGGLMNTPNVPKSELVINSLGGLLLFDDNIQENANNIFPPSAINMIGNGCNGVLSSDVVTEMGSFNESESGWQSDGSYVQVWDYTTSQANGTIACASLTSKVGGYVGWGNGTSNESKYLEMQRYVGNSEVYYPTMQKAQTLLNIDYTNSVCKTVDNSQLTIGSEDFVKTTGKIEYEVRNMPLTKLNLKTTTQETVKQGTISVNIPNEFLNDIDASLKVIYGDDSDIYLTTSTASWNNNTYKSFLKINMQNNQTEYIRLLNTTGINIQGYNRIETLMAVINNNLMIQNYTNSGTLAYAIFKISLQNNMVTQLENWNIVLDKRQIITLGTYLMTLGTGQNYIIDTTEMTYKKVNRINSNVFIAVADMYYQIQNGNKLMFNLPTSVQITNVGWVSNIKIYRMPFYLATINNLETPVVKTPEKTMKVTYRLTF